MQVNGVLIQDNKNQSSITDSDKKNDVQDPVLVWNQRDTVVFAVGKTNTEEMETTYKKQKDSGNSENEQKKSSKNALENMDSVMSHLSATLYTELQNVGVDVKNEEPQNIVTVEEKIQISLATYCDDFRVTDSSITEEDLKHVCGDNPRAYQIAEKMKENNLPVTEETISEADNACQMASSLKTVDKGTEAYLLKNGMEPSIQNVYKAQHSGSNQKIEGIALSDEEWNGLRPQVEKMLTQSGLEENSTNLDNAKWIIEQKIPLNVDKLQDLSEIQKIPVELDESQLIDSVVSTMSLGLDAKDALLTGNRVSVERAEEAVMVLNQGTEGQIETLLNQKKDINIQNLKTLQSSGQYTEEPEQVSIQTIEAKRKLEEIRLSMTVEAGMKMMKKGFHIETASLEALVNELKESEKSYYQALQPGYNLSEEETSTAKNAVNILQELKTVPNYVIGMVAKEEIPFNVESIHEEGTKLQAQLREAGTAYESLMTVPRSDLGDSYQKAFQSVDSLVQELGLPDTEASRRAIRILGYNQMELSEQNINQVKNIDYQLSSLMTNMTPKVVMHMITNGINPLQENIEDLNSQIESIRSENGLQDDIDKYSEFLWKMDKTNSVSDEEREAYIGIYRLLYQVEKTDGSVIGSLVNQGADITLKNLQTAVRNRKSAGIDVQVTEQFGTLDGQEDKSDYYNSLLKETRNSISPEKLDRIGNTDNVYTMDLEQFAEQMSLESEESKKRQKEYIENEIKNLGAQKQVQEGAVRFLEDGNQPVTFQNLMAAGLLINKKTGIFQELRETNESSQNNSENTKDSIMGLIDSLTDEESMNEAYDTMSKELEQTLTEKLSNEDTSILDLNKMKQLSTGIRLLSNMSRQQTYQIPLELNGEMTAVNLRIVQGSGDSGKVTAEFDSDQLGKVSSVFRTDGTTLNGLILCDSTDTLGLLSSRLPKFTEQLEQLGLQVKNMDVGIHKSIRTGMWNDSQKKETDGNGTASRKTSTGYLYKIAKIFLETTISGTKAS